MQTQAHIFYSGSVQGVGFRYTVQRFAENLDLKGWVKNLRDGRVEILIEGKKDHVEQLIADTDKYFGSYIQDKKVTFKEAEGVYKDFQITF